MIEMFLVLAQVGGDGLPEIPSWEYLGGLTVALFFAYLFVAGKIISGKDADERVSEWKNLAKEATKENAESTQELVKASKEFNQSLTLLLQQVSELNSVMQREEYETREKRNQILREIETIKDEMRR